MLTRRAVVFAAGLAALFAAGCVQRTPGQPAPTPLPTVSPLPAPSATAPIASVAPTGQVDPTAQILIRFSSDLIALQRLESPDETAILAHFSIEPALPGRFRFLTPHMIGFEADRAWPVATRMRVRITAGIREAGGHTLPDDVSWTFQTAGIALEGLPSKDDATPAELRPKIRFTSNVPLDRDSLQEHARIRAHGASGDGIALLVPADTASPGPSPAPNAQSAFDPSAQENRYVLVPQSDLAKNTDYDVVIDAGVLPRGGNLPSDRSFTGRLRTHDDLRLVRTLHGDPQTGRFAGGDPRLQFSTPVLGSSLGALSLSPAPPKGTTAFSAVDTNVGINVLALAPNTAYTVSIGPDLRDTFGQRLGAAQTATFRTGDLLPDVWAPSGTNLFPAGRDVRLNVVAVNAPKDVHALFRPLQPADVVRYPDLSGGVDRGDLLPPAASWPAFDARGAHNIQRTIEVPLRAKLGGPDGVLAYGVAAALGAQRDFLASGVVQLTDLGVFAQWYPDSGNVRVHRIADGTPVGGARVEVYPSQADAETKSQPVACATALTGADGVATFARAAFTRCAARDNGDNTAPAFVTIVRHGSDWTYVRTADYSGAYSGDFFNGWSSATPLARGTIYSDRRLYKPGETAQMTAVGWFLVDGVLRRGSAPSYALTLDLPSGEHRDLGRRSLNVFGTFSIPVALAKDAPVGYYVLRATAGNGETISGDFRVAEFKPPNFKVDLALDRQVAERGATVNGTATSAYLFGAPLTGASTKFTVTRSPADFTPKGREQYQFGRRWFWPEQQPDASTDVLETTAGVDAGGKSTVAIPVANDLPYPMTYVVDADTTDASNIDVADSQQFTALPTDTLIGIKADDVGTAGTPLSIGVIATDPAGASRPGTNVHVELQAATYANATQIVEGAEQAVQSVTYATVASADTSTAQNAATVSLTPPKPGSYRVHANLAGATGDAGATDVQVYVGGPGTFAWFENDPNLLTVKLDRSAYKPGEVARVLVQSPFPEAELHVAVVRHGVLWEKTQLAHGAAPTLTFTVTPGMLPNAVVEAFVVRRGAAPRGVPADQGNALARVGFAPFDVKLDAKYLTASVHADAGTLEPGKSQTVHVHLADRAHHPLRAQATVMVVNDAVLRLTGYRPPNLVESVYAQQPISTRYADNRTALVLATLTRPLEKGWGFGGGLSGDEPDPRVRHNFAPLAYFAGALITDAQGNASATFTLPDDLTTWRVMVVGASADGRFGNGETTFRTTKELVANPVMPQFARPGDRFDGGLTLTNGTGATGSARIDASFAGPLAFVVNGKPAASTSLDTPLEAITTAYRFPVVVDGTGEATVTVRVRGPHASDAFSIPLTVRDLAVSEAVAQTGTTTSNASVGLDVARDTPRDSGGLDLALASSLIPEVTVAANAALQGDERLAISAASRLAIASDLAQLAARTGTDARSVRDRAAPELGTLRDLRRKDGGFAPYWQAEGSDPWDSLTALAALGRARDAKIPVDTGLFDGARRYGAAVLADPAGHAKWCTTELCKAQLRLSALDALAAAGDRRTSFLDAIDAQRDRLSFADRARLARLLTQAPEYASRATSLAQAIGQDLYATARGAAVSLPSRYAWLDDPVVAQAEALRLELVRKADSETIDRLTRSLLDMRRNGSFGCACENAAALGAIVDVAAREAPADFTATATLAGRTLASEHFTGARAPQRETTVAMRDLPAGRNQLGLAKDGAGTLHYAVTYRYRVAGAAPGRLNGLRITRVVRAANTSPVLATMGLALPAVQLTLTAAHVYDVELQIVSDHPVDRVVISDPLPAGFEAVDTSFATASKALQLPSTSWELGDQQIRADRIDAYADHLEPGVYTMHYLARSVTPGTFGWPGADAHLVERPDEFGRSAASIVVIR